MTMPEGDGDAVELARLVEQRVARMRPKLLDLSRRNPLVSTSFGGRSHAILRIVDELPAKVIEKLSERQMRFVALPDIETDPKDEDGQAFQDALSNAKRLDEEYLGALADLEAKGDPDLQEQRVIDRALRDRVRVALGMVARQTGADISLAAHARAHGISPGFELPPRDAVAADGRFDDRDLQTLMLPEDLERRLNGLISKGKSWVQETGVNVMHVAIGFIEWTDATASKPSFAPLLLAQVEIIKVKTAEGAEFFVKLVDDQLTLNHVFAQKLQGEHSLKLPDYDPSVSVEDYFERVAELKPHALKFRLRRQVAFGVFPSARIAMFQDLGTQSGRFGAHPVVSTLLGGGDVAAATPFADEYPIDNLDLSGGVPETVLDADSSQLSAMIDVLAGKDLALEGPPGTGKSQTIVNLIAAAMARGKRVLFIAEKTAALEVVQSRLRSLGLEPFVLPLQATRSGKEQVIQSLRDRLALKASTAPRDLQAAKDGFKRSRGELATYLRVLAAPYRSTGFTVHDVLGRAMAANDVLASAPAPLRKNVLDALDPWTPAKIEEAGKAATAYEAVRGKLAEVSNVWRGVGRVSVDRFSLDGMRERAAAASRTAEDVGALVADVPELDAPLHLYSSHCAAALAVLQQAKASNVDLSAVANAVQAKALMHLTKFASDCERVQAALLRYDNFLLEPLSPDWPQRLERIGALCESVNLANLDKEAGLFRAEQEAERAEEHRCAREEVDAVVAAASFWAERSLADMEKVRALASGVRLPALAMRHTKFADAAVRQRMAEAVKTGAKLSRMRGEVLSAFAVVPSETPGEMRDAALTLRGAGFFARFGETFQEAKALHRGVARDRKFSRNTAADQLLAAAEFKEQLAAFEADGVLASLTPELSRGLDTDFASLSETLQFADKLEAEFPGLTHKAFRQNVLTADLDVVQSLPSLSEAVVSAGRPDDLARRSAELAQSVAALHNVLRELDQYTTRLKRLPEWDQAKLAAAASGLRKLQPVAQALNQDQAASSILARQFKGWQTSVDTSKRVAAVATEITQTPLGTPVVTALLSHNADNVINTVQRLGEGVLSLDVALKEIGDVTRFAARVKQLSASKANEMLEQAASDHPSLQAHAELGLHRRELEAMGLNDLLAAMDNGWEPNVALARVVEALVGRCMALDVFDKHGTVLGEFSGSKIDQLRARIVELDQRVVELTKDSIRRDLVKNANPPEGVSRGRVADKTEMGLIDNETPKTKQFVAVRSLVERAGRALLELKPCWMMSPLAVAQYLPANISFDLCIIDEASQMPPEDALGAILRSKQVLVVGDTNQLPPSSFFKKLIDDGGDDDDAAEAVVEESILELSNQMFRPARRLRWHYRSKHGSLIAFSNNHIYDDNLIVFPSAEDASADKGVSLVRVNGRYGSSINPEEAKAVVEAAIAFMLKHPDRSLGIVTVNQPQRDLIQEELQTALNLNERATAYVEKWADRNQGLEEFFVKNLENVQGDERDAIFISTVYGPPAPGQSMRQNFGPINGVAGRRRLNVLFSRAKQQVVTFTSMSPTDIHADENGNAGAYMLRCWLEYSATGVIERGRTTQREPDSEFEVYVIQQLKAMGVEPVPQVGVAGYFVDIGIRHPSWPHGYILGVECDGASYHSAPSARDRDRLRQRVLEDLGWKIHRIWSTDWFLDPAREADRLRVAIDARLRELGVASIAKPNAT